MKPVRGILEVGERDTLIWDKVHFLLSIMITSLYGTILLLLRVENLSNALRISPVWQNKISTLFS